MEFFTESFFVEEAKKTPLFEQRTFSVEDSYAPLNRNFDVFLSYNIADQAVVKAIYYVLKSKGVRVYLDCIVDSDMQRSETDKDTARRLHARLEHSNSLLYAQSPDAAHSNWMPWELGVMDGRTRKCFIMPVTNDAKPVTPKREYLSLYPYIKPDANNVMKIISEGSESSHLRTDFIDYIKNIR